MKIAVFHAYPVEPDGLSIQGNLLYKGLKELSKDRNIEVVPCHYRPSLQKQWVLSGFKPDLALGVGCWSNSPDIVFSPQRAGVLPVPWFVANGWVANYHKELGDLPLVLTTSNWVTETYARDGVDTKNFVTLPIGFDPEEICRIPQSDDKIQAMRSMLGVQPHEKMILTVGGDVTSKGAQEMLRALAEIDKDFPNWKYVLKASDSESAAIHGAEEEALIEELGIDRGKVVYFNGMYSHDFMSVLLAACDIYAAPSRLEGFGMIQMEAEACGKPVISINVGGPVDTIVHGQTGYLADIGQAVELKEEWAYESMGFDADHKIVFDKPKVFAYRASVPDLVKYTRELLMDDARRLEMGQNAYDHAMSNFHYQLVTKKFLELIDSKLNMR